MQEIENPSKPFLEETLLINDKEKTSDKSDNNSVINSNTSTNNGFDTSTFNKTFYFLF